MTVLTRALIAIGQTIGLGAITVGKAAADKAAPIAIVLGIWTLITWLVPGATIEQAPAWNDALDELFFPAFVALSKLPIVGTMVQILIWAVTFEVTLFLVNLVLKIARWAQLTGDSPYSN